MKKIFVSLATGLFLILIPTMDNAFAAGETDVSPLSNKEVLVMVQNHVPEDAIIKAIKSSRCTFDTFPPVLKDMKRRGVSDAVLQAMLEAPYGPSAQQSVRTDDAGNQLIYHYADQLKQMGYVTPTTVGRGAGFARQSLRTRASRARIQ